ncbi:MAG: hypothetical protein F6J90_41395 [Moorea sp. SIOASIH]|nr:hypothetical protein [Moorena sp. SIOASIH]
MGVSPKTALHRSYTNTKYQYQFSKYLQQINSPFPKMGNGEWSENLVN